MSSIPRQGSSHGIRHDKRAVEHVHARVDILRPLRATLIHCEGSRRLGEEDDKESVAEEVGVLGFPDSVVQISVDGHGSCPHEDFVRCDSWPDAGFEVRDVVAGHVHPCGVIVLRCCPERAGWDILLHRVHRSDIVRLAPVLQGSEEFESGAGASQSAYDNTHIPSDNLHSVHHATFIATELLPTFGVEPVIAVVHHVTASPMLQMTVTYVSDQPVDERPRELTVKNQGVTAAM